MENIIQPQAIGGNFEQKITGILEKKPVIYQFLRFVCIGFLNTALNFLILNSLSKFFGVNEGWALGAISAVSFCVAVIQSYLWNRTWAFGSESGVSLWQNFVRLVLVGVLGVGGLLLVFVGSRFSAPAIFFLLAFLAYLIFEGVLWKRFGFNLSQSAGGSNFSFVVFFLVTLVGLGINVSLISLLSPYLHVTGTDLDKNIAAALATGVSLIWNFLAYKIIVFRK